MYRLVNGKTFQGAMNRAKLINDKIGKYAHDYTLKQLNGMNCYICLDGNSGFSIKSDGDLVNVFSSVKGRGNTMLKLAIQCGATKLDCFDGYLPKLYAKHGFITVKREANWNDISGPDCVYMVLSAKPMKLVA